MILLPDHIKSLAVRGQQGEKKSSAESWKESADEDLSPKKIFIREKKKQWILFPIISQIGAEKGK